MTKILDTLKYINNPAALKSLIEELKKLLAECEGKPGANDYQTLLSALVQIESTLNALSGNVAAYVTELQKFVSQIEQLNNAIKQETNTQKRQDLLSQINSLVSQMQTYMVNNSISIDGLNQEVNDIEASLQKTKLDIRELRRETGLRLLLMMKKGKTCTSTSGFFKMTFRNLSTVAPILPLSKWRRLKHIWMIYSHVWEKRVLTNCFSLLRS
ncbi:MAG: hypothetical protein LVR00_07045 [Rhabdochlamydiaceae bacterium]|jgi:DNA repair exonuclease SbcCD ATPase subunit